MSETPSRQSAFDKAEILFKPYAAWLADSQAPVRDLTVDSCESLAAARKAAQRHINLLFMERGVDIIDIDGTYIHPDTQIGAGTVIYPGTVIRADVTIGEGCSVGPFAYLRPGTRIGDSVKVGDFVEIKNSTVGSGTAISHLAYVGDGDIGRGVNFGCGAVTVNYDGKHKHRAVIGDGAFIGCNTNLIAPVAVGSGAYTAAGSTITDNVPDKMLSIARARQVNKEDWTPPRERLTE
jgi:bifunctional UDP-N-acetylglucosamine pyrophosphorylase/glucosamine-1-phosphate N-acetyltransferase